ncbi:MAG TPA: hypothetical protein VGG79_13515 [Roseiarcus sp.]|jgi:ATP-dependent DNA ligase
MSEESLTPATNLLHLDGRAVSGRPLLERKALLEPANKPRIQFNGPRPVTAS